MQVRENKGLCFHTIYWNMKGIYLLTCSLLRAKQHLKGRVHYLKCAGRKTMYQVL